MLWFSADQLKKSLCQIQSLHDLNLFLNASLIRAIFIFVMPLAGAAAHFCNHSVDCSRQSL